MTTQEQHYLTPQEVARHLRVETRTVHNLLEDGTLDGLNVGRLWRIPHNQLDRTDISPDLDMNIKELPRNMCDYDRTRDEWSNKVPEYFNFGYDIIDAWAKEDRNKLAMIWVDQQGNEKKYTFRDMMKLSNQAANILLKYGINKGDRVMLMLHRVPEWWIFVIALAKLGAVACPCPTLLTSSDLQYRTNAGQFKMVITDLENAPKFDEIREHTGLKEYMVVDGEKDDWISFQYELLYPAPVSHHSVSIPVLTKSTDPLLIYFTSGTTGKGKMVLHDHAYPLGHRVTAELWQDLTENDLHFTYSDTGWAKCAWGKILGQWIAGCCVFIYDARGKFKATELLPLLEKYEITTFCCPPTIYRMLILADLSKFDLTQLRHCCSAGEPLNPEVIKVWKEGTGLNIYEGYGQTETCCAVASFACIKNKPGSMGKPTPGWNIELHDDQGRPVDDFEEGRMAINTDPRPPGLLVKYLNNEQENGKAFQNGFYYTGDKAYRDEEGYFWFVGRDDDVIKSSGYRIGPFEVESALLEHPGVQESAVIGVPDNIRGMIVKAFIVLHDGVVPSDELIKELQDHVKRTTAPYKYPRAIEFVEELPKTIGGKIKRKELRHMEAEKARCE